jgi:short subunit dehydrogenase-like uncharacterized protein
MTCLLYGSYGYTGKRILEEALTRGLTPILAGRNSAKVKAQAEALGLEYRAFELSDRAALEAALHEVPVVLHAAGPFSQTWQPMVEACLKTGTHYLDITGELEVFEQIAQHSDAARTAEVMLLPGAGFDVAPSDCLAAHLKSLLPDATHLRLGFRGLGKLSRGTSRTALESFGKGGAVREGGRVRRVPAAHKTRDIDFGRGPVPAVTIPWGDVVTAYYSTGIPNIEVYMAAPPRLLLMLKASRYLGWLARFQTLRRLMHKRLEAQPAGPTAEERQRGASFLWGEVNNAAGETVQARLKAPEAYTLTARSSVLMAQKVLAGDAPIGFQTPSSAYQKDFILEIEGVEGFLS